MPTKDFHFRGDQHTVNGLTAYKLLEELGEDNQIVVQASQGDLSPLPCYFNSDVYIRHLDESEDLLGSSIAQTSRNPDSEGYQDGTWDCPATSLVSTDVIKIVERVTVGGVSETKIWITEQLGWTKLNAAIWTFHRYTAANTHMVHPPPNTQWITVGTIAHGISSYDTQLQNVSFVAYSDIGLRIKTGAGIVKIGVVSDLAGHRLRIRKGAVTYAIPLLGVSDDGTSGIRIYDGSAIKALPKVD
jgi:hypothetical protein